MITISIIVITAACFFAAILNLAAENRFRNRIMGGFTAAAVIFGILFYGYGFAFKFGSSPVAVLRALLAVCRMFGGVNDLGTIEAAPLFAYHGVRVLFWLVHFMAFYVTASAAIATIGGRVLRKIRVTLLRRGTLLMIYGVNAHALEYGRRQISEKHRSVVFIGQDSAALEAGINAAGAVLEKSGEEPDAVLLRRLGIRPGKRRIEIAALHEDGFKNYSFVCALLQAMQEINIHPEQTALLVQGVEEEHAAQWQARNNAYGFGSVMAFDEYELVARLMVHKIPPCASIQFDEKARAKQNFEMLMIGFGRMGRAALDALVKNGQFCGSTFRADIFDINAQNGTLHDHEMLRQYDIRFHEASGKSDRIYAFLNERKNDLRYIVICTGDEMENQEIARDIGRWLRQRGAVPAIVQCARSGLMFTRSGKDEREYQNIYGSDALDIDRIDRTAMIINQAYCKASGKTPAENWKECDYFSRMSSRASADFYPAVLRAAGKTAAQAMDGDWPPQAEMLENQAITEHLRWCAFHYAMGFHPMSEDEFAQRSDEYRARMQSGGTPALRIGKDMENRKHACLVPWDALDALSARENSVTKGHVDYKQMDRNNILVLPELLKELDEIPEEYKGGTSA